MKANEFVKKFGWDVVIDLINELSKSKKLEWYIPQIDINLEPCEVCFSYTEIKRLVESYELVEKFGGLDESKKYIDDRILPELSKAILDVESCQ